MTVPPGASGLRGRTIYPGVSMLSEDELNQVERRLLEERSRAVEALREFDRERENSLEEDLGELTSYRFHPADIGTESMEREQQFLLASNEGRRLNDIDESLRRLYTRPERVGICERCGRPLSMERLEVVPTAILCADCQSRAEGA